MAMVDMAPGRLVVPKVITGGVARLCVRRGRSTTLRAVKRRQLLVAAAAVFVTSCTQPPAGAPSSTEVIAMRDRGLSVKAMRAAIDDRWAKTGPSTRTPYP